MSSKSQNGLFVQALIETFYVSGNRMLTPFLKITQIFILKKKHLEKVLNKGW